MNTLLFSNLDALEDIFVPLGVCVVLPCLIVFLTTWVRRNEMNRKAEIAIKAIEHGAEIDPQIFQGTASQAHERKRTYKGSLFRTLKSGIICAGLGAALLIMPMLNLDFGLSVFSAPKSAGFLLLCLGLVLTASYFIGRKIFAAEIKAEEEKLQEKE